MRDEEPLLSDDRSQPGIVLNKSLRLPGQVSKVSSIVPQSGKAERGEWQTEKKGHREGEKPMGIDREEASRDLVAQLVVLRPTDPVDEEVSQEKSGEHGCREGSGTESDASRGQVSKRLDRTAGVSVGREGKFDEGRVFAENPELHQPANLPDQKWPTPRLRHSPGPERSFQPFPLAAERGDRVVLASDPVKNPVSGESGVVNCLKPRQMSQQVRGEPAKSVGLAEIAQGDFEIFHPPIGFHQPTSPREPMTNPTSGIARRDMAPKLIDERVAHEVAKHLPDAVQGS